MIKREGNGLEVTEMYFMALWHCSHTPHFCSGALNPHFLVCFFLSFSFIFCGYCNAFNV